MRISTFIITAVVAMLSIPLFGGIGWTVLADAASGNNRVLSGNNVITAVCDKRTYRLEDRVVLHIHIENMGKASEGVAGPSTVRYRITCDGAIVEDGRKAPPGLTGDVIEILEPGEYKDFSFVLNKTYLKDKFQKPGKYTVQVSWAVNRRADGDPWDTDPTMNLISNVAEFEILPPAGNTGANTGQGQSPPETTQGQAPPIAQTNAKAACWPWYAYALIAAGVLITGAAGYLIIRRRRSHSRPEA
jgi:hypothetical protein